MNPNDYQREAARTEASQHKALHRLMMAPDPTLALPNDVGILGPTRLLHGIIGVINELGEITSLIQKKYWYGKDISDEELAKKVLDEAGDIQWHLMQILSSQGVAFGRVLEANIAKLKARYPDAGWSAEACENRDREAEAKAVGGIVDPTDVGKDWPYAQPQAGDDEPKDYNWK